MRGNYVREFQVVDADTQVNERTSAFLQHLVTKAPKNIPKFGRYLHMEEQNLQVQKSAREQRQWLLQVYVNGLVLRNSRKRYRY